MRELLAFVVSGENSLDEEEAEGLEEGERIPLLMHSEYDVRAKDLIPTVYKLRKEDARLRNDESAVASETGMGATMSFSASIAACIHRARKSGLLTASGKP
eukprot:3755632-Pleurochrysis_carterae.AAC.1